MMKSPRIPSKSVVLIVLFLGVLAVCMAPAALTTAAPQNAPSQALLAQADEILQEMSQLTGLPIKEPVKKEVISRPEIEKYLTQNIHDDLSPAELHAQEALVRALGLVPRDFDLEKFLISFYTEQAAGFYDPKRKTMFIADWVPEETQSMVLSHELTHALQDQSWDLESYLHGARGDDDATDARQAVVEGYATAAMLQHEAGGMDLGQLPSIASLMDMVVHQQFDEFPSFSNAPYFFREEALFPYVQGMGFIQAGLQHGGWKDVNQFFDAPPDSTKQIFEPQVYFNHQTVPAVALAHPPVLDSAPGLTFLSDNMMGELGYYCLVGQLVSDEEGKALSPSWLGDRYLIYERTGGDAYTLVARNRWTNAESASTFFRDYHSILTHKYSDLTPDKRSTPDEFIASAANGRVFLLRKGDECLWAEGVPPAKAEALLEWLRAL